MTIRHHHRRRNAATALETAIVLLVLFVLIIGIISGGWLVFRYQQVACLAREGSRWASVRGSEYQRSTNRESPTQAMILDEAILPFTAGLDPSLLEVTVAVIDKSTGIETDWDRSRKDVHAITVPGGEYTTNTVRVSVAYRGVLAFFGDAFTVESRCEIPFSH